MKVIADLEVHSKYARAVSPQMVLPTIAQWAQIKGIGLVGTGDFTHPMWFREIESLLTEVGQGIFRLKNSRETSLKTNFLLTSEVSCIYSHRGKSRRVHMMVFMPDISSVRIFNEQLTKHGANLFSDGRPIMGLSLAQVADLALTVTKKALIIPAHVWTPWFGFYGSMSGYESLSEAFDKLEKYIPAVETGLSSDPAMNWRIAELTGRRIVSFGDAHSPQKLGREATVFELEDLSYDSIGRAVWGKGNDRISSTVEFYPEEGKYHYSGHRKCNIVYSANEARKKGMTCPVCSKHLTMGVTSRVETLASIEVETDSMSDSYGVRWIKDKKGKNPSYIMLVPLHEVLSEALVAGSASQAVTTMYEHLINTFDSEFNVMLHTKLFDIGKVGGQKVADAVQKVRSGDIYIKPGYDGVFGTVKIWKEDYDSHNDSDQASLF